MLASQLTVVIDTPWDEPSEKSPEFMAYLSGEILEYDPWTRIRGQARGEPVAGHLSHAELSSFINLAILLGMLNPDPSERFTLQDIRSHQWSMT
jgi:serine/threonine-protein kinase Chk1